MSRKPITVIAYNLRDISYSQAAAKGEVFFQIGVSSTRASASSASARSWKLRAAPLRKPELCEKRKISLLVFLVRHSTSR